MEAAAGVEAPGAGLAEAVLVALLLAVLLLMSQLLLPVDQAVRVVLLLVAVPVEGAAQEAVRLRVTAHPEVSMLRAGW